MISDGYDVRRQHDHNFGSLQSTNGGLEPRLRCRSVFLPITDYGGLERGLPKVFKDRGIRDGDLAIPVIRLWGSRKSWRSEVGVKRKRQLSSRKISDRRNSAFGEKGCVATYLKFNSTLLAECRRNTVADS
ncbi:hypothetical protein TNCV_398001 [Trichonephila clavipes]|nr:hypothetical protein TNCV_398001 [Trichonephila clavipes]